MKNILWIVGLIVVGVALLFLLGGSTTIGPKYELGQINEADHTKGLAPVGTTTSGVLIVEYSDFQCPACRSYYPIVRQLVEEYKTQVTFVYRHFPLISIHGNAEFAARASEAAALQGKFWEMHDLLFEKQNEWASVADIEPLFISYATLIGIDAEKFRADWVSKGVKDIVKASRLHSLKEGLQGTPTFFVNGQKIENPNSLEQFKAVINSAIK